MNYPHNRTHHLLTSPLGCAFLAVAGQSRLTAEQVVTPRMSFALASRALGWLDPWTADYPRNLEEALRLGRRQGELARAVLEHPGSAWWYAPLDRERQVWAPYARHVGEDRAALEAPPSASDVRDPATPLQGWERYAQKPATLFTSTLVGDGEASLLAALAHGATDLHWPHAWPVPCWRLTVAPSARVYEVDGPQAWHDLCARYPARLGEQAQNLYSMDWAREDLLVPDWTAVARDWDGVHLTFGGLLSSDRAVVESAAGRSVHWGWDFEGTAWLRWAFVSVERLPDYQGTAEPEGLWRPGV